MFQTDLKSAICAVVEAMPESQETGLYVRVRALTSDKSLGKASVSYIHLIFHKPSRYVKVFSSSFYNGDYAHALPPAKEFEMLSDHDSCWRYDGVDHAINSVYFEQAKKVNTKIAPINLDHEASIDRISQVKLKMEKVDEVGYMKRLISIHFVGQ